MHPKWRQIHGLHLLVAILVDKLIRNSLPDVFSAYQCTIESRRFDLQVYAIGNGLQCLQPLATSNFPSICIYLDRLFHALCNAVPFRLFHLFVCGVVWCGSFDGHNECIYISLTDSENGIKNPSRQCAGIGVKVCAYV